MGLFSFIKNVGKKLTGNKEAENLEEQKAQNLEMAKLIYAGIKDMDLAISDLQVTVDGDKVILKGVSESQADKEKAILEAGNTTGIAAVEEEIVVEVPEPESKFYEVKSGDSLSKIAKTMYGDAMKYPVIFEANKPMLSDPNKIYPGQVLRIPEL